MFKERKMEGQKNKNEKYFGGKKNKKPAYEIKIQVVTADYNQWLELKYQKIKLNKHIAQVIPQGEK